MKSEGVHITLCCEHCGERVPTVGHVFQCEHCHKDNKPNQDVADALMEMARRLQAMTPEELAAIVEDKEPARQVKCEACKGTGKRTLTILDSKKMPGRIITEMCPQCLGTGKVTDAD